MTAEISTPEQQASCLGRDHCPQLRGTEENDFLLLRPCCFSHSPISPSFVTLALARIPKWTTQCADHWTPIIFPTNYMREENCSIHGEHKITSTDYGTIPAGPSTLVSLFLHWQIINNVENVQLLTLFWSCCECYFTLLLPFLLGFYLFVCL